MKFYITHGHLTDKKDGILPAWKRPTLTAGMQYTFEFDGDFPAGNYVLSGDIDFKREDLMMKSSRTLEETGQLSFVVSTDTEGFWKKPRFTGEKLYLEVIREGGGDDGKVEPILKDYVYCTPRIAGETDDPNALHASWNDLVGKPSKFPPEDHTHKLTDVTGLTEQDGKLAYNGELVNQPTKWEEIPDKPEEFEPKNHTHTESEITDLHKHPNKADLDMIGVYTSAKGTATFKNMDNGGKIEFTNTANVTSNISLTDGSDKRHIQLYSHDPNGKCTRIAINPTGAFYADTNGNDFDEGNKIARIKDLKNATIVLTEDQKRELKGEPGVRGADGTDGKDGKNGVTFTPSVSEDGVLSWTNDGQLANPEDVTIKGERGERGEPGTPGLPGKDGTDGAKGAQGDPGPANVLTIGSFEFVETEDEGEVTIDGTSPSQTLHFKIPKGPKGDNGADGQPGAAGTNGTDGTDGKDAGFGEITAKAETATGDTPEVTVDETGTARSKNLAFTFKIPRGEKGENGAAGSDGQQGPQGNPGKDAKIGNVTVSIVPIDTDGTPTGSAAVTNGSDGAKDIAFTLQLPKGDKGEAGNPGKDGSQGERGEDGTDGKSAGFGTPTITVNSIDYEAEATGSVTADGDDTAKVFHFKFDIPKGEPGATGERGPAGPAGTNGTDGKDGQPGKDAKIGDASAEVEMTEPDGEAAVVVTSTEDTGAGKTFHFKFTLPKGEKGDDGTPGAPGQDGAKGSDGTNGKDAGFGTPEIDVVTLPAGTNAEATVEVDGTSPNTEKIFKFHFKIPKGDTGAVGPAGKNGTDGAQGERGTDGTNGKDAKIGNVTATACVASGTDPKVEINATPASTGENTTDFSFTFEIPKGEKGDAGQKGEDGAPGAQGQQGEAGQPGPQGPAGPDGQPGKDGQNGKDAPKHVLLFTCPESDNGLHLEVTYRELNEETKTEYKSLVDTATKEDDRKKVKGNHGGLNWVECPEKGFGSVFGGWPVLVDLSQVDEIDVSKIYSIRYRWIANSGTGTGEEAAASEEAGTGTDTGIASDWYAMIYPCATEAPVSSNPGAALPQIADMQENSVLFFSNGKYSALTIDELKKLINSTGTSS